MATRIDWTKTNPNPTDWTVQTKNPSDWTKTNPNPTPWVPGIPVAPTSFLLAQDDTYILLQTEGYIGLQQA